MRDRESEWCEKVGSNVGTGRLITEEGREEGEGREGRWDRRGGGGSNRRLLVTRTSINPPAPPTHYHSITHTTNILFTKHTLTTS